jgi:4-hydroxybenzoate polyprenyltransferase
LVTAASAVLAAWQIDFFWPIVLVLLVLLSTALFAGWHFLEHLKAGAGKRFELIAALWTLCMYLSLGAGPLLWKV